MAAYINTTEATGHLDSWNGRLYQYYRSYWSFGQLEWPLISILQKLLFIWTVGMAAYINTTEATGHLDSWNGRLYQYYRSYCSFGQLEWPLISILQKLLVIWTVGMAAYINTTEATGHLDSWNGRLYQYYRSYCSFGQLEWPLISILQKLNGSFGQLEWPASINTTEPTPGHVALLEWRLYQYYRRLWSFGQLNGRLIHTTRSYGSLGSWNGRYINTTEATGHLDSWNGRLYQYYRSYCSFGQLEWPLISILQKLLVIWTVGMAAYINTTEATGHLDSWNGRLYQYYRSYCSFGQLEWPLISILQKLLFIWTVGMAAYINTTEATGHLDSWNGRLYQYYRSYCSFGQLEWPLISILQKLLFIWTVGMAAYINTTEATGHLDSWNGLAYINTTEATVH